MARQSNGIPAEAKVGVFVAFALASLVYLTTIINQSGLSIDEHSFYDVYFDNVSGLLERTPVEYSGIRVGYVEEIAISKEPSTPKPVRVRIRVTPDVAVYDDSLVALETRGLLGEKIIMITGGGQGALIPPGGAITNSMDAAGFENAVQDFSELTKSMQEFFEGGAARGSLVDVIDNTTVITEELRGIVKGKRGDIESVVSNLKEVSEAMREFTSSEEGGTSQLKQTINRFENSVASLQEILARIERGEGTVGKLLNDETTVNKMNDALDGINEFVGDIKQLEIAVGFRGEYMSSEGQPVAITSFRFRPAFDKYFLFEFTDGPITFGDTSKKITVTETNPPGTTITETTNTQSDGFLLTAIFARRFYDLTLKAGLFRSSGYFGAEYHLFNDHLSLNLDAFNFNRDENPQLRAFAKFNFFKVFFASAGVDDLIHSDNRRNYFGGLGFFLTDDDLKRLLGLAPIFNNN